MLFERNESAAPEPLNVEIGQYAFYSRSQFMNAAELFEYGRALVARNEFAEALDVLDLVLGLDPFASALQFRGHALVGLARFNEAVASYSLALALEPHRLDIQLNRVVLLLSAKQPAAIPTISLKAIKGKRIQLHHTGGFGDTIQFVRYALMLEEYGARLSLSIPLELLSIPLELKRLSQGLPAEIGGDHESDLQCTFEGVPAIFRTEFTIVGIVGHVLYLRPPESSIARWRERLPSRGRFRVGLAWSGQAHHSIRDDLRPMQFETLAPLLETRVVELVSLMKWSTGTTSAALRDAGVVDLGSEIGDFADTAAVVSLLDLVITIDTSVAHLAGALGTPAWIMLSRPACCRWLVDRSTALGTRLRACSDNRGPAIGTVSSPKSRLAFGSSYESRRR